MHPETGAGILQIITWAPFEKEKVPIQLNQDFQGEWVYAIDLVEQVLEVYKGVHERTHGHRFEKIGSGDKVPSFICSFAFAEL